MIFSKKLAHPEYNDLYIGITHLQEVTNHQQLGMTLNNTMTWEHHVSEVCKKAESQIALMRRLPSDITQVTKLHIYTTFIHRLLEYGSVLFVNCTNTPSDQLENTRRQAALAITRAYQHTSHTHLLQELQINTSLQVQK